VWLYRHWYHIMMLGIGLTIAGAIALVPIRLVQMSESLAKFLDIFVGIGLLCLGPLLVILGPVLRLLVGIYHWRCRKIWPDIPGLRQPDIPGLRQLEESGRYWFEARLTELENEFLDICECQEYVGWQIYQVRHYEKEKALEKYYWNLAKRIKLLKRQFKSLWILAAMLKHAPAKTPGAFLSLVKGQRQA